VHEGLFCLPDSSDVTVRGLGESSADSEIIYNYIREIHLVSFFDMQLVHISCHVTTIKYKIFKMILIYMIFILNSVFTIVLYVTR
jgi:hypothetical protein